jgi:hypothetical protein
MVVVLFNGGTRDRGRQRESDGFAVRNDDSRLLRG